MFMQSIMIRSGDQAGGRKFQQRLLNSGHESPIRAWPSPWLSKWLYYVQIQIHVKVQIEINGKMQIPIQMPKYVNQVFVMYHIREMYREILELASLHCFKSRVRCVRFVFDSSPLAGDM